jgi:tetratricopeptide (TPR) repeat protein
MSLRDRSGYQPVEDLAKAAAHLERAIAIYREGENKAYWAEAVAALASLQVDERARYRRASQEQIRKVIDLLENALHFLSADARPSSRARALFYLGQALLEDVADPKGLHICVWLMSRAGNAHTLQFSRSPRSFHLMSYWTKGPMAPRPNNRWFG